MKTTKLAGLILGALMLALAVPAARASEWNQATKFTFSQPFQVPGQVLPAGTYWFETVQTPTDANNVVVIYNADRSQPEATVLTRPAFRTHGLSKALATLGALLAMLHLPLARSEPCSAMVRVPVKVPLMPV